MYGTEDVACCHSQHGSVLVRRAVAWLVSVDVSETGTLELSEIVWMHVVFTMRAGAGI